MNKRITRSPEVYRNAAFLASCSADSAFAWLRDRPVHFSSVTGTPHTPKEAHILEYVLFRRRDLTIDVALAQYGRSGTVLTRLYNRASDSVRVIACSNASLFVGDVFGRFWRLKQNFLWDVVFNGPIAELRAICENPHISSGFYGALVEAWQPEDQREEDKRYLAEDRYIAVLGFLAENPRISQPRKVSAERNYLDGMAEYDYNRLYVAAWRLAAKAPATPQWASALANLYRKLHVPYSCLDDPAAVIARWKPENEDEGTATRYVRDAIAGAFMKPTLEMLNSDDPSMRQAFYRTFNPDTKEFRDLDWNDWIDRDPQIYFDISSNELVWASPRGRANLNTMLWHGSRKNSDLLYIGFYKEQIEQFEKEHPQWFEDDDIVEDDFEHSTDSMTGLRREIRELIGAMASRRKTAIYVCGAVILGLVVGVTIK